MNPVRNIVSGNEPIQNNTPLSNGVKLLVFSPFYPPHIGGLESHADEFNRHLSQHGVNISVFTPRLPADAPERETRHHGVAIVRYPAFEPIHNYPLPRFWNIRFWRQWKNLWNEEGGIVVSRTRFFFPSLMALWYAHRRGLPLLHIEHGSDFAQFNGRLKTALGKLYDVSLGRFVLRHADAIVGNSQASANFVKKLSGRTDCQVIYRGANIEAIEASTPRADLRAKYPDKMIIAFIGRLIDGKGAHDLITAIARLQRRDIVCLIIGGGPEEARLKKMTEEHDLIDHIVFFGNLPFSEAIGTLKIADIVVNPSYTEGLPTSVTEAALCQKAIIATDVGGTSEVLSGNNDGFLIPPRRPDIIAEKLTLLIENPTLRATFSQNAFAAVKNRFSWDRSANQYLAVFNRLSKTPQD